MSLLAVALASGGGALYITVNTPLGGCRGAFDRALKSPNGNGIIRILELVCVCTLAYPAC